MRLDRIIVGATLLLALLVIAARQSAANEVKKIAKIATIAYLVHKHLNPKGPTAYHISEPHARLGATVHGLVLNPTALFNVLLRKSEFFVSKMLLAHRLLSSLVRLTKMAEALPLQRPIPAMAVLREEARLADQTIAEAMISGNNVGNVNQLLGLVQGPGGEIDVGKVQQLLRTFQPAGTVVGGSTTGDTKRDHPASMTMPGDDGKSISTIKSALVGSSW